MILNYAKIGNDRPAVVLNMGAGPAAGKCSDMGVQRLNRRQFLKLLGASVASGGLSALGGYGYATQVEPYRLSVERLTLPLTGWPERLAGLTVAQLSDFHLYPFTPLWFVEEAVAATNALQPDVVVLTGDYVSDSAESIFDLAPVLARLNPRLGLAAILGNHDHWAGAPTVRRGLRAAGIPLLENSCLTLSNGLIIAGLDDPWAGRPDLPATLAGVSGNAPLLLLAHEPDFADEFTQDPRVRLQLSGHSHGGQVRLPGLGAPFLPRYADKYDLGLYQVNQAWLYTNRGIGMTGAPVRFNCPPEITLITLA